MRTQVTLLVIFVGLAGSVHAASANGQKKTSATSVSSRSVYLCTDADGKKEYRNTGITKGCKKVNLPGLTNVSSATKRPPIKTENTKFPNVKPEAQKKRDDERKEILERELRTEEEKLAKLKSEYKGGQPDRLGNERNYAKYQARTAKLKEDVERSEKNVEALKREIANLR